MFSFHFLFLSFKVIYTNSRSRYAPKRCDSFQTVTWTKHKYTTIASITSTRALCICQQQKNPPKNIEHVYHCINTCRDKHIQDTTWQIDMSHAIKKRMLNNTRVLTKKRKRKKKIHVCAQFLYAGITYPHISATVAACMQLWIWQQIMKADAGLPWIAAATVTWINSSRVWYGVTTSKAHDVSASEMWMQRCIACRHDIGTHFD